MASTKYLQFSAYSIKDMITRKLSEDTRFTDQVYEGSNLAILIDIFSYMAQSMLYALNSTASESMFSDTQIYENMNRLVKFIGYNPRGCYASTVNAAIATNGIDNKTIPKFTAVNTSQVDGNGKTIYYSFCKDYTVGLENNVAILKNGVWKLYPTVFTASGVKYETFTLTGVKSDSDNQNYVINDSMYAYVERDGQSNFTEFTGVVDEVFVNTKYAYTSDENTTKSGIMIYDSTDAIFSIRLNENKDYEIKFGNGIQGQQLKAGDRVYVFYLDSNGQGGEIQIGDIENQKMIQPISILGITKTMFLKMTGTYESDSKSNETYNTRYSEIFDTFTVTNTTASTIATIEEDVDSIRQTAPNYYKIGNRLVTKNDYIYYIKNRYSSQIIDVQCMNNWEYASSFYRWLYSNSLAGNYVQCNSRSPSQTYYLNEARIVKYGYTFSDAADSNNVYLWLKMKNNSDAYKTQLDQELLSLKSLTQECVFLDPVQMNVDICAAPIDRCLEYFKSGSFDPDNESYIEILIDDSATYVNSQIQYLVNNILLDYFSDENIRLGQVMSISNITNQIMSLTGVQRIRTVFNPTTTDYNYQIIDGLSLGTWSSSILDEGEDLTINNQNKTFEDFQYPKLYRSSFIDKIKVIKKSITTNNNIQY